MVLRPYRKNQNKGFFQSVYSQRDEGENDPAEYHWKCLLTQVPIDHDDSYFEKDDKLRQVLVWVSVSCLISELQDAEPQKPLSFNN